ncbi:MAG: hypothetical protein ACR2OX_02000, partial [Methyloligellaceae bacterium]
MLTVVTRMVGVRRCIAFEMQDDGGISAMIMRARLKISQHMMKCGALNQHEGKRNQNICEKSHLGSSAP